MLFNTQQPTQRSYQPRRIQPRPIVVQQQLPGFMRQLKVLCHAPQHPLPCKMEFIGFSTSDHGDPISIYACRLCNSRQGWCLDHRTNQPRPLFTKAACPR